MRDFRLSWKERVMSILKICKILIIIILHCTLLYADAPYEQYHVAYNDISKDVLKNTIGILTINSGVKKGMELKTYSKSEKKFIFDKILRVKETTPISNFGYHPPIDELHFENYRYPIVGKSGQYLQIVYDPKKNLKAWINIKEVKEKFFTSIVMLDSIKTPSPFFVDIFYLTKNGRRKLYKEPKNDADFIIISKNEPKYSMLKIIEQKNGFVKIGIVHINFETLGETIEPIGWIKIRDNQGMLTIWIMDIDLC